MKTMHSIHKEYFFVIMTMMNSNQKNSIYENAGNYSWGGGGRDVDRVQVTDFNMLSNSMIQYTKLYFAFVKRKNTNTNKGGVRKIKMEI